MVFVIADVLGDVMALIYEVVVVLDQDLCMQDSR